MYRTTDVDRLRTQIDRFSIPMFIAEPNKDGSDFVILALNAAHEKHSGMVMADVTGRTLAELLPKDDARDVRLKYSRCIAESAHLSYRELLHLPAGPTIWDTSLHHIVLPDGSDRIVGGAVLIARAQRDKKDEVAFEDVQFFATNSSYIMSKIAAVFEAYEHGHINENQFAQSSTLLAGLCRTVETTLDDLRALAEERLRADPEAAQLIVGEMPDPHVLEDVERALTQLLKAAQDSDAADGDPFAKRFQKMNELTTKRPN